MDIFCLYIRVKIKADMVDEFKQRFSVLAKHVKDNEPLTLSCASPSTRVRRFPVFPGSTRTALLFPLTSRHARFLRPLS